MYKITDLDMFGHNVNLNFDKKGCTHNTLPGGVFSLMVRCLIAVYIYILFRKLIKHE